MIAPFVPRAITIFAVNKLAEVDYTIANRVTEDISKCIKWSYMQDLPATAKLGIDILQLFDNLGSILIIIVVWLVKHTK